MGRKVHSDAATLKVAGQKCRYAGTVRELKMALAIIIPERLGVNFEETAQIIGVSPATVSRFRKNFSAFNAGKSAKPSNWGGRRRSNLSLKEEMRFIEKWSEKAEKRPLKDLVRVQRDYEWVIGGKVPKSTIHRMMARHGWKKIKISKKIRGWRKVN